METTQQCPRCGTEIDGTDIDLDGVPVCPQCGAEVVPAEPSV